MLISEYALPPTDCKLYITTQEDYVANLNDNTKLVISHFILDQSCADG